MSTFDLIRSDKNEKTFPAGTMIFKEGDDGNYMAAVVEGQVDIMRGDRIFEAIGPEGLFGEMALISKMPRAATAIARTDTRLVIIDIGTFYFLIQHAPFFAIQVMQVLVERVRRNMEA